MPFFACAFFAGVAIIQIIGKLPSLIWCAWLLVTLLFLLYFLPKRIGSILLVFPAIVAGIFWTVYRADRLLAWHLPTSFINKTILITSVMGFADSR